MLTLCGAAAEAQLLATPETSKPQTFTVSRIKLTYSEQPPSSENPADAHSDQPRLDALIPVRVELRKTEAGWAAPLPNEPTQVIEIGGPRSAAVELLPSGLAWTLRAIVSEINKTGLYGIDVRPASTDIDLETEQDLRAEGDTDLQVVVRLGRVSQVRTIALGDRIRDDWKINNELHEAIREQSPIQPLGGDDGTTPLLDRNALEDYLYRLNRHSGRRVEAALSPGEKPGEIVLDYRVAESKPWFVYAQTSNTGTRRTEDWQTRVGVIHRQITNRDDILSIEYMNGGKEVNGIRASYEAPFFGPKRPDWMKRRTGDPAWFDWIPREKIPWWGVDRLRWRADLSYGRFEASGFSFDDLQSGLVQEDAVVSEEYQGGGQFLYEAWQHKSLFLDVITGARLRYLHVKNKVGPEVGDGEVLLFLPRVALRVQQFTAVSNLGAEFGVEGQILDTDQDERERLGRQDVDGRFAKLDFNLGYSTYLEPVLFPTAFENPESRLSSTLAHEIALGFRGQYAFDYRLIPQTSQVLGGLYSVRGYEQSQAVGDSVFIASFEYRFHIPRALPIMREPVNLPVIGDFRVTPQQVYGRSDWDLTLRAFVDVGRAVRNRNGIGDGTFEDDDTLVGVGFGAELQIRSNLRARIDWATALVPSSADGEDPNQTLRFGEKSEVHLLFSILY